MPNVSIFFNRIFLKLQWGFCKGFNDEQCLILIINKWRKYLNIGSYGNTFLNTSRSLTVSIINCSGFNNWHMSRTYARLLLMAYAWFWTCVRWHLRSFFPYDFLKFSKFSGSWNFILLKKLLLYIWPLFVLGRDRFFTLYICFKETLLFDFSYKLFKKYFFLPQSTCQFRMSVRK